jgi:hypothetical protein
VVGSFKEGNEYSGSIKGLEFLIQLNDCWLGDKQNVQVENAKKCFI